MTERWIVDDCGTLIDMSTRDTFDYVSDVAPVLNRLVEENEQLIHDATVLIQANQDYRKENEQLKSKIKYLERKINRERISYWKQHEKWEKEAETKIKELLEENGQLKKELKRCKEWINSDKNDYELTLAFIKSKGYSLKDVLEYEKELEE